jgi:hypothetical protein
VTSQTAGLNTSMAYFKTGDASGGKDGLAKVWPEPGTAP